MAGKRKRKSVSRGAVWKWVFIVGLVLMVVVAVAFAFFGWMKRYLKSDEMLEMVQGEASGAMRANVEIEPLEWTGFSVYTDKVAAKGTEEAVFSEAQAESVRLEIHPGGLKRGVWEVSDVSLGAFDLVVGPERPGDVSLLPVPGPETFWDTLMPDAVEISDIGVERLGFRYFGDGVTVRIADAPSVVKWKGAGEGVDIRMRGGSLVLDGVFEGEMKTAALSVRSNGVHVHDLEMTVLDGAQVTATGEVPFDAKRNMEFRYRVLKVDLDDLAPESWRKMLSGVISSEVTTRTVSGLGSGVRHEGKAVVQGGKLEHMPVLDLIAEHTRTDRFRTLVFNLARARFVVEGDRIEIYDLEIQSDSLIRVEGKLVIEGGAVDGDFEVGVTSDTLRWIPGAEQRVFTERRDGLVWTDMKLSGTAANPVEDLSGRLKRAAIIQTVQDAPGKVLGAGGEVVGEGAGGVLDLVNEAAGALVPGGGSGGDDDEEEEDGEKREGLIEGAAKELLPLFR